jgi:hypothetical protein
MIARAVPKRSSPPSRFTVKPRPSTADTTAGATAPSPPRTYTVPPEGTARLSSERTAEDSWLGEVSSSGPCLTTANGPPASASGWDTEDARTADSAEPLAG